MIRNVQLTHSGQYVCEVRTAVDSVSSAADLIVRGVYLCSLFRSQLAPLLEDRTGRGLTALGHHK